MQRRTAAVSYMMYFIVVPAWFALCMRTAHEIGRTTR